MTKTSRRQVLASLNALPFLPLLLEAKGKYPPAPEFAEGQWLNSSPIRLAERRGKVTIVHFWTYACINCKRNMDIYKRWHAEFAHHGVEVIGVHTPETEVERRPEFVAQHIAQYGVKYPVLLDQDHVNWRRWKQEFWPTVYVIDKGGMIRADWEGELEYKGAGGDKKMSGLIRSLIHEA